MEKRVKRRIGVLVVLGMFAALALATPSIAPGTPPNHDYALDSKHYKVADDWYTDYPEIVLADGDGRVYIGGVGGVGGGNQLILRSNCDLVIRDEYAGDNDLNLVLWNNRGVIRVDRYSDCDAAGDLAILARNVGIGTNSPTSTLDVAGNIKAYNIESDNMPGIEYSGETDYINVPTSWTNVRSVGLTVNSAGYILVTFTGYAEIDSSGGNVKVAIDNTATGFDVYLEAKGNNGDRDPFSVQYVYHVYTAGTYTYYGNAQTTDGISDVYNCRMTAIYVPNRY